MYALIGKYNDPWIRNEKLGVYETFEQAEADKKLYIEELENPPGDYFMVDFDFYEIKKVK
jgi:hypothetical protein